MSACVTSLYFTSFYSSLFLLYFLSVCDLRSLAYTQCCCEFCLKCEPKSTTSKETWTSVTSTFALYVWPSLLMLPNSIKLLSFNLQNSFTHSSTAQCHSLHFSVLMIFTHVACLHASLKLGDIFTPYGFRGDSSLNSTRKPPSVAGFHGFR